MRANDRDYCVNVCRCYTQVISGDSRQSAGDGDCAQFQHPRQ